jgi:hypothetical protein
MTRRSWMLAVAMAAATAGGVWAGMTFSHTHSKAAAHCCDDPTCPPGCSDVCPPNCTASDCCDDPTCPPGCSEDCPPNCQASTAKGKTACPPCPLCP